MPVALIKLVNFALHRGYSRLLEMQILRLRNVSYMESSSSRNTLTTGMTLVFFCGGWLDSVVPEYRDAPVYGSTKDEFADEEGAAAPGCARYLEAPGNIVTFAIHLGIDSILAHRCMDQQSRYPRFRC